MSAKDASFYLGQYGTSSINRVSPHNAQWPDFYGGVMGALVKNVRIRNRASGGKALGLAGSVESTIEDVFLDAPGSAIVIKEVSTNRFKDQTITDLQSFALPYRDYIRYPSATAGNGYLWDQSSWGNMFTNVRWTATTGSIADSANNAGTADANATNTFTDVGQGADPTSGPIGIPTNIGAQIRTALGLN